MPQADVTLNLLCSSWRQPKLSAYDCLNCNFVFNQSPLAPPGTRVVVHVTPEQRPNMAPHGVDGWYVGPSPEHYRCYKSYIASTFGIRDALTVDWFPYNVPFPKVTTNEYLRKTGTDMLTLLQGTQATPIPSTLTYGSNLTDAYIQITQILKRAMTPPASAPHPAAPEPRVIRPIVATPYTRTEGASTRATLPTPSQAQYRQKEAEATKAPTTRPTWPASPRSPTPHPPKPSRLPPLTAHWKEKRIAYHHGRRTRNADGLRNGVVCPTI
jgi:hypothetical protein